ncbi:MAG: hypothetical protein OXT09_25040 [Myxococcales bacterium]|nr:hypothetical protein [Myxococcales bacterium]
MKPTTVLVLALGVCLACGDDGSDGDGVAGSEGRDSLLPDAESCAEQVRAFFERAAECRDFGDEVLREALQTCETGELPPGFIDVNFRPEFQAEVASCSDGLSCEEFVEDQVDHCYPGALEALAVGLLQPDTIEQCIVSRNSEACVQHLTTGAETLDTAPALCFRRFSECEPQRSEHDPFWTEDHCAMILALTDEGRAEAQGCLGLPCAEAPACLVELGALNF